MKKNNTVHSNTSSGFTIVELMIATAVFSTILVAITFGFMHFSGLYYKGVYTSETQNIARDISDEVSNAVRYGTGEPKTIPTGVDGDTPQEGADVVFCAGGYRFVTRLGVQYVDNTTPGFYMQPQVGNNCANGGSSQRKQLLAKNMRVAGIKFYQNQSNVYTFKITIAYGDDDLLTAKSDVSGAVQCKTGAGATYCAVSSLITTIEKRI